MTTTAEAPPITYGPHSPTTADIDAARTVAEEARFTVAHAVMHSDWPLSDADLGYLEHVRAEALAAKRAVDRTYEAWWHLTLDDEARQPFTGSSGYTYTHRCHGWPRMT